jgi:hypothetical protein
VVIEVPGDERNVDVAGLADRLAVVHRLEHGKIARMLLDVPRDRVEVACPAMSAEVAPCRLCTARGSNRRIHISRGRLRDLRDGSAIRGIDTVEVLAIRGFTPRAIDEETEAALLRIEPFVDRLR